MDTIVELCAERLPKNMGYSTPRRFRSFSPTRKNHIGGPKISICACRRRSSPEVKHKKEKAYGNTVFREGDKVMQIRNNYDIIWRANDGFSAGAGVYNGDIGHIKEIDFSHETLTVDYEDKLVTYLFEQLSELEPAYALTVHKSQGSEYQAVILACTSGAPQLLARSVIIYGRYPRQRAFDYRCDPAVFETMVSNDRRQRRYSGLRARLADHI